MKCLSAKVELKIKTFWNDLSLKREMSVCKGQVSVWAFNLKHEFCELSVFIIVIICLKFATQLYSGSSVSKVKILAYYKT